MPLDLNSRSLKVQLPAFILRKRQTPPTALTPTLQASAEDLADIHRQMDGGRWKERKGEREGGIEKARNEKDILLPFPGGEMAFGFKVVMFFLKVSQGREPLTDLLSSRYAC